MSSKPVSALRRYPSCASDFPVRLLFVPGGSTRGGEGGTADHVFGHHGEDVVQTVADVQGSGLRSGALIAVMDGGADGQMLQDGLQRARGPAFGDLAQSLQLYAQPFE